jgi:hypothetical protein
MQNHLSAMHPRSTGVILASATFAPTKKCHKPAKVNPLASDINFFQIHPNINT